jgi:hypothetical protein
MPLSESKQGDFSQAKIHDAPPPSLEPPAYATIPSPNRPRRSAERLFDSVVFLDFYHI